MSTSSNEPRSRPPGATGVGGAPARRKWVLPLILGLLGLLALLLLLSQCGGDDDPAKPAAATTAPTATTPTATTPSVSDTTPSGAASAGADQAGQAGTVVSGGDDLLGAANAANLPGHDTEQAEGRAVRVQSVPADEGFWVGTSETERLWVQLTGTRGESDYEVKQGDTVDFTGTITRATSGFADKAGVTAAEGAEQLTKLGYYVSAPASSVKLSS